MSRWFHHYGKICATHPWEVILLVVASTVYLFTIEQSQSNDSLKSSLHQQQQQCIGCLEEQFKAVDVVVMTIIRCCAILYSLHQLRNLQTFESKYILGIAGIFPVISSFVYTSTALNFLKITLVDLKDAIFFFLLSSDLTKAATLAQFATTASTQEEISTNIAIGMSILGPTITLDTIVETLVIGVGTLSGVQRLEMLSYFACLAILVNYIIFMTFYPACLSLMLELMRLWNGSEEKQQQLTKKLLENEKVNAAVQRVKIIMSIGLTVVHIHSRWYFKDDETNDNSSILISDNTNFGFLMKQFALNADHIVILVLVVTLIMKFVFFENDVNLKTVTTIKQHDTDSSQLTTTTTTTINNEKQVQTLNNDDTNLIFEIGTRRNLEECLEIYRSKGASYLTDCEIILLVDTKHIPAYNLEKILNNEERGVKIRRQIIKLAANCETAFINIPYKNYDYSRVMGVCCENVIGYIPIPLGIVGPLRLDDKQFYVPMSTTEGCLVASTNRGCRAVEFSGVKSQILGDGMTRGPVVRFHSALDAGRVAYWLKKSINFDLIKTEFDSTSRFARLTKIQTCVAGRYLYLRFVAETGDAMGMNMLSKGTEKALICLQKYFPTMEIISLSGNYCTDKKPAAINWIEGRGKSVVCEAIISKDIVTSVLKTNSKALVDLHIAKNLIGSAMAGSIGGFNAHAANIITAIFIATGQDPAQNITSSNCLTLFEQCGENGQDLRVSCTMPSIELGTIGGGTILPPQSACLEMLGIKGPNEQMPGENARQFARIVCATVLVGELSLMAALTTGDLVKSHLKHNRSHSDKDNSCELVVKDC